MASLPDLPSTGTQISILETIAVFFVKPSPDPKERVALYVGVCPAYIDFIPISISNCI